MALSTAQATSFGTSSPSGDERGEAAKPPSQRFFFAINPDHRHSQAQSDTSAGDKGVEWTTP